MTLNMIVWWMKLILMKYWWTNWNICAWLVHRSNIKRIYNRQNYQRKKKNEAGNQRYTVIQKPHKGNVKKSIFEIVLRHKHSCKCLGESRSTVYDLFMSMIGSLSVITYRNGLMWNSPISPLWFPSTTKSIGNIK